MPQNQEEEDDDIISKSIGQFGRWQLQLTFLLSLVNIPCTWHIFVTTFQAAHRTFYCSRPSNVGDDLISIDEWLNLTDGDPCWRRDVTVDSNGTLNIGTQNFSCYRWDFEGEGHTLIEEFGLVCDRKTLNSMAEMMFLTGVAIGGLVCGIISDKYGRKKTLLASIFIQAVLGCSIAFAPWFEMYYILRAIQGFFSVSVVFSGFVLSIELVGGNWRTVAGISYLFPVPLSYMSIAAIAWFIRDWRQLELAISLPGFLFLGFLWILPESPRWLLAMGHTDEVMKILEKAAIVNGKKLPPNLDKQLLPSDSDSEAESVNVMDLFRTQQIRRKTFLLFIIWFVVYLVYYGVTLNLNNIGGDIYINSVLLGAVEIPAIALSIVILLKGGRRWTLALTTILSGIACICIVPIKLARDDMQWLVTTFTMISKFGISSSNAVMPVFTAELYPTTIRNIGVGAANVSAGIALMLVPYLFETTAINDAVPMSVLAGCGIVGGFCVLFLPETAGSPLKDTLKEEALNERRYSQANIDRRCSKAINNNRA